MSEQQKQQSAAPVVNLQLPGEFGAEEIKQVKVDHNRPHPSEEQALGWFSMLRLPSDPFEIFGKTGVTMAAGALFSSLALHLALAPQLLIPLGTALLAISTVIWAAALRYKSLRANMLVYFLLFSLGSALGVGYSLWGLL